jgi:hypothetical protein
MHAYRTVPGTNQSALYPLLFPFSRRITYHKSSILMQHHTSTVCEQYAYQNQQEDPQMSTSMGTSLSFNHTIVAPVIHASQINAATLLASPRMSRTVRDHACVGWDRIRHVEFDVKQWHDNRGVKKIPLTQQVMAQDTDTGSTC